MLPFGSLVVFLYVGMQLFGVCLRQTDRSVLKKAENMKKMMIHSMVCGLLVLTASCVNVGLGKKVKPSDTIVEKEYRMEPFTKLDINVFAQVKIVQGAANDYRVVLKAPDNYLELFDFRVDDGELELGFKRNTDIESRQVKILVVAPVLNELENSCIANVTTDSLTAEWLKIENSGVGKICLKGLSLGRVSVECSGVGNVELSGTAERAHLECSGVGSIDAKGLKARRVMGEVSGVGGIDCYASDSLKALVSGVGSLQYAGQPQTKNLRSTGVGKISEL